MDKQDHADVKWIKQTKENGYYKSMVSTGRLESVNLEQAKYRTETQDSGQTALIGCQ